MLSDRTHPLLSSARRIVSLLITLPVLLLATTRPVDAQLGGSKRVLELTTKRFEAAVPIDIVDGPRLRCETASGTQTIDVHDCVRWQTWNPPREKFVLELIDGSWLVGDPTWNEDGSVRLRCDWLEEIELRNDDIRTIVFSSPGSLQRWGELLDMLSRTQGADDTVWDRSGRRSAGIVRFQGKPKSPSFPGRPEWPLEANGKSFDLQEADLFAIAFSPILRPARTEPVSGFALGLRDGSRLQLKDVRRLSDGRLSLIGTRGQTWTTLDTSDQFASSLQFVQADPQNVRWVADITPARFRTGSKESLLSWPLGLNRDLTGKRLVVDGDLIERAVAMHSPAQAAYRHDRTAAVLNAWIGVRPPPDAADARLGSAVFKVLIGKDNQLTEAFVSGRLTPDSPWQPISVDLTGAQLFALVVEESDLGSLGDHCVWREARVVKQDNGASSEPALNDSEKSDKSNSSNKGTKSKP